MKRGTRRAVFLDRDGVLNRAIVRDGKPYPPQNASEVEIISGVAEYLALLKEAGFVLIVVTNQPDIARGSLTTAMVKSINACMAEKLPVDCFIMCTHDNEDGCDCRKPKPGMLFDGANRFGIDLRQSFMVGDRWRDIEAGNAAGCKTIFIDYGYNEQRPSSFDYRVLSVSEALMTIHGKVRLEED